MEQWMRDLPLTPKRGQITDINGIVLADTSTSYKIFVRPRAVTDPAAVSRLLSKELNIEYSKLYDRITTSKVSEITVANNVDRDTMLKITDADLLGIYISESILRYYPYGDFLTQVLGYVNVDGNGQEGLEKYLEKYLFGEYGYALTEADLIGTELNNDVRFIDPVDGYNVSLTIDYYIQSFAEAAVTDAMLKANAKSASCMVMDVNTGAILALANAPSFDLNHIPRNNIAELFQGSKNHCVTDVFEPGSIFKILTSAAVIESNSFSNNKTFFCPGYRIVDGQRIKCWKTKGHGSQTFAEGIKNSCNCVFMDSALALGTDKFYDFFDKFGLTRKTGLDMYGESRSILIPREQVKTVDLVRIGFGQAIAVSPLQLLTAVAASINGGRLYQPYITDSVYDKNGNIILQKYPILKTNNIVSGETSRLLCEYLEAVVKEGSGKMAYVDGYRIGGKTGTAQKYVDGRIAQGKYISSFIGFAPADNPQYVMLMMVNEPVGAYYGSIVAAPYAKYMFENIFARFDIRPDPALRDPKYNVYFEMPDLRGMKYADALAMLRAKGLAYEMEGEGDIVVYQLPAPGSRINRYTTALVEFN